MQESKRRVLLAVGGTGGHLFPAQALARDLKDHADVLFAGHGLSTNRYFKRDLFSYEEIPSSTPRKGIGACLSIANGVMKSRKLLRTFQPDVVVGFGSFHSFPILLAVRFAKVPFVLFSPDAIPGQVNRLFARKALFTGVQFQETATHLKGKTTTVQLPCWCMEGTATRKEARAHYGLDLEMLTLLVFGGSQGAKPINDAVSQLTLDRPFQVIHIAGERVEELREIYAKRGIRAHVASFEEKMERAYRAADLAICRSGAATLGELIAFELPALLIPWPGAADNHQEINARIFAETTRGGGWIDQKNLSPEILSRRIAQLNFQEMKQNLVTYRLEHQKAHLAEIILNL